MTSLPRLLTKLREEGFDGVLRMRVAQEEALVLLRKGAVVLEILSPAWATRNAQAPWTNWISSVSAVADLDELTIELPGISYRRELRDLVFEVIPGQSDELAKTATRTSRPGTAPAATQLRRVGAELRGASTMKGLLGSDPAFRALSWLVHQAPAYFAERERTSRWKYLAEWIPLVRTARLHHALPRPNSPAQDSFDLVTFDKEGKALHLVDRVGLGTPAALEAFVARVLEAKQARIKGGDVGTAILIAPSFEPETLDLYRRKTSKEESKSWIFGLQNSLAHYDGFIRIGTSRGFHLLLVQEEGAELKPILPD